MDVMDTTGLPRPQTEWEELQRECHPFPVYVDYVYGRDIREPPKLQRPQPPSSYSPQQSQQAQENQRNKHGRSLQNPFPALHRGYSATTAAPAPVFPSPLRPDSTTAAYRVTGLAPGNPGQIFPGFHIALETRQPSPALPYMVPRSDLVAPVSRSSAAIPQNVQGLHILQRDELLQPRYNWFKGPGRIECNETVAACHSALEDLSYPQDQRLQTAARLIELSAKVLVQHTKRLKLETAKQNLYKVLPKVWGALKTRNSLPPGHAAHEEAGKYLRRFIESLDQPMKDYAGHLVEQMAIAESEGGNAADAIPGRNRRKKDVPVPAVKVEESYEVPAHAAPSSSPLLKSSPLPEWKGF
ncbi:hypothetical protein K458DRAFT_432513 [Lentithecium fluviatile CBS 122367]|uniref:Uncharacterized protein n=1 Tax=Lentithecium fluviatile CBS 122367 TaxID=1168545 RepID=A0A6G1IY16_9PLEO|nr:hypothetical protein K458DRAFT_432513 [Lentithecium fluviatile CBS 122367]